MKFIKISLTIIGGFLLIGLVAAGVFVVTFDANDYKPQISEQVKQHTGRELVLADIKPAVFPWLGIELQQLSLSNANGFKAKHMVQIEKLDVRVAIMPLLTGDVRIDTLRVHGLQLSLAKDKQGRTNWDDILEKQKSSSTPQGAQTPKSAEPVEEGDGPLAALMVNGVEIKDASINWNDAVSNQNVVFQDFNLETGAFKLGQSMPVKLNTHIELSAPKTALDIVLQTKVDFDPQSQALKLSDLEFSLEAALNEMGIKLAQIKLVTALDANLKNQTFKLPAIELQIDAKGDAIPGGKIKSAIKSALEIDLLKQTAIVSQLNIATLGLNMQSQLSVSQLLKSPSAKGEFKLDAFNAKKLLQQLAIELPEMQGKKTLQNAAISFEFTGNEQSVNVNKLAITLDKSKINGAVSVTQLSQPAIQYQLSLDNILLDDYLPPPPPESKTPAKANNTHAASTDTPIDLPVEMLRDLNIKGSFKAKKVQALEQMISNILIETDAKNGLVKLPVIKASLLEGSINASAQLDVRQTTPRYQFSMKAKGLDADSVASPIIQDMLGEKDAKLTGASNLDLKLSSKGQSVKKLVANSNGQFKYSMGKAELHNVDIEFQVREAVASYMDEKKIPGSDKVRSEYKPKSTNALRIVRASANIKNGLLDNKDLLVDSSKFKITGAGQVDLVKELINYRAVVDLVPNSRNSVGQRLLDEPLPVNIKGGFSSPDYDIKTSGLTRAAKKEAKQAVKKQVDQKLDKKVDKIKDKYKDKLKNLFR